MWFCARAYSVLLLIKMPRRRVSNLSRRTRNAIRQRNIASQLSDEEREIMRAKNRVRTQQRRALIRRKAAQETAKRNDSSIDLNRTAFRYGCTSTALVAMTSPNLATINDPMVASDLEIGPIKIEQGTSTDDESNEEPELETPAKKIRISEQLEPKNEKIKKRGKNFSPEEELILVELVEERNDVLNNKKSDAFTWKHKEEVWAELTNNFVAKTGVNREWRQLRDKYLHMKRRAKVELAKERAHCQRMGGGEPVTPIVSTVSEKIVAMIGDAALRLKNALETDGCQLENEQSFEEDDDMMYNFVSGGLDANDMAVSEDDLTSTSSKWATSNMANAVPPPVLNNKLPDKVPNPKSTLDEERLKLLQLRQDFCRCENERAQEKHELEMYEKRSKLEDEARERKLRIELLELEIKQKKAKQEQSIHLFN
ncbi:uncharacterized protein LOC6576313 isoform X1 [Drosophila mojavensis]|nr:uncharacterized protein LOC6576313 isoform X1 [Drosophila mojavensis]